MANEIPWEKIGNDRAVQNPTDVLPGQYITSNTILAETKPRPEYKTPFRVK